MTLSQYLEILRARWKTVAASVLVMLALGLTGYFLTPAQYESSTLLYISAQAGGSSSQSPYESSLLSEQRATAYAELLASDRVGTEVARDLALNATPASVTARLAARTQPDSVVLTIVATDTSAATSADLANSSARVLSRIISEVERPVEGAGPPIVAARIVQQALPATSPSAPSLVLYLGAAIVAGSLIGLAGAFSRHYLDVSIGSSQELERTLDVPVLGEISRNVEVADEPLLGWKRPQSPFSESIRAIRTNVQFLMLSSDLRTLLVTSPRPAEGKTTVACNLAASFAQVGHKVLLLEGDLRRPRIASSFGLEDRVGLTSVLLGRLSPFDATQGALSGSVQVIAGGPLPPNPSELLASERMLGLLKHLESVYDLVIVDSPPVGAVTDGVVLGSRVGGVLLVVADGVSGRPDAERAVAALKAVGSHVVGSILTMTKNRKGQTYGAYGREAAQGPPAPDDQVASRRSSAHRSGADADAWTTPSPMPRGTSSDK